MHRLRYHAATLAAPPPPPTGSGQGRPSRPSSPSTTRSSGPGRRTAAFLAVAIVALLGGGTYAVTQTGSDGPTTAELTALAQGAVLIQADFPAGWAADPPVADEGPDEGDRALAECLGAPYDDRPNTAETSFSSLGVSVTSEFSVAPSLDWARAEFDTVLDGGAPGCFEQVMASMLNTDKPAGASYDIDVTRFDVAPMVPRAVARNATGLRASIKLRRDGVTVPMTFDAIMLRHDRIAATLAFNSVGGTPFPDDLRQSLTTAVVNRLTGSPQAG